MSDNADEERVRRLERENEILRTALDEIVNASRDAGLSAMCNWMRGRAAAALSEVAQSDGQDAS